LLGGDRSAVTAKVHRSKTELATASEKVDSQTESTTALGSKRPLEVHGVRILELTERTSSVMKSSELEEYSYRDPVVNAFRTFAQLNNVAVSGGVSIVPEASYAETLTSTAADHFSDLILIPWSESGTISETGSADCAQTSGIQDSFIREILGEASCNTAVFVNRGFGGPSIPEPRTLSRTISGRSLRSQRGAAVQPIQDRSHHVYFPFFGGADDRVALRFALQLAQNSNITATIIHFNMPIQSTYKTPEVTNEAVRTTTGRESFSHLSNSEGVDTGTLYAGAAQDTALLHALRDSLPAALSNRVVFVDVATTTPMADCLDHARQEMGQSPRNAGDLVVVGRGKHTRMNELAEMGGASADVEMRRTLGAVAEAIISGGVRGSVLVIQAGARGLEG
jgi:hypothetical protein